MIRLIQMPIALLLLSNLMAREAFAEVKIEVNSVQLKFEQSNEDLGPKMKPERNSKITLTCTMTGTSETLANSTLKWNYPSNETQDNDYRLKHSSSLSKDGSKMTAELTISDLRGADIGNYTCIGNLSNSSKEKAIGIVASLPMLNIGDKSYDIATRPGEAISIKCEASANPAAQAKWEKQEGMTGLNFSTSNELKIASVTLEHRGKYVCKAKNSIGENSVTVFLRVKNPNSFVVPLIVIVVELIILAVIVVVYELMMRKKRQEAALSQDKTD